MKTQLRAQIATLIEQGLSALRSAGTLPADLASPEFVIERPKDRAHGDFSTNAAMLLAKAAKTNPRALAQQLVDALPASDALRATFDSEPRRQLQATGGDDYELCFSAPAAAQAAVLAGALQAGVAVTRIGRLDARGGVATLTSAGADWRAPTPGWQHFAA